MVGVCMMSVQSYLERLASRLVLTTAERQHITTSISALSTRLNNYFGNELIVHDKFGSYTRGTILPRSVDSSSDVDYMVVFKNSNEYKPQTLLTHLKRFVGTYYSRSEIYQSSPTMVLELKHIKFELVPAIHSSWKGLCIPAPNKVWTEWTETDPTGFNSKLTRINSNNGSKIKPLIRIMKYWNTLNRHYYSSYLMEDWLCNINNYGINNLKDYFYNTINTIDYNYNYPQYIKNGIDRAKEIVNQAGNYEYYGLTYQAEQAIKKLLPDI